MFSYLVKSIFGTSTTSHMEDVEVTYPVIIYCRISSANDNKGCSLASQAEAGMTYCHNNNYTVDTTVYEIGSAWKNPKQTNLECIINNHKNVTLIVNSIDRFSRNVSKGIDMINKMIIKNIKLVSLNDTVDLSSATGRASFRNLLSNSELESDKISERCKRGSAHRKRNGHLMGRSPYGYAAVTVNGVRKKQNNREEAAIIKFIINNLHKKVSASEFTTELYKLLYTLKKPLTEFVPVIFEENYEREVSSIHMSSEAMANILNDYNISKRNNDWTSQTVSYTYKKNNIETLMFQMDM